MKLNPSETYDRYVGDQTPGEFMAESVGKRAGAVESAVEAYVDAYQEPLPDDPEAVKAALVAYISNALDVENLDCDTLHASDWIAIEEFLADTDTIRSEWLEWGQPEPPDGEYYVIPEGGGWEYWRIAGGRAYAISSDAENDTHAVARDGRHVPPPKEEDNPALLPRDDEVAILVATGHWDWHRQGGGVYVE